MQLDEVQRAAQEQFARQSHRYGRGHILENVADIEAALTHIPLSIPSRVLDVATGGGHTALFFASLGHEVTASDITQQMLDRVASAARERNLKVQTRLHSAESMPYPAQSFDLATCRIAPHHFSAPAQFVRETARVLVSGGFLLVIDGTVEDGQPEAEEWAHEVEKLRDPSHNRLITPNTWRRFCADAELRVTHCAIAPFKQPDLNWYFDTANTSSENRKRVLELVRNAPESARRLFKLGEEDGKIVWWWQRLALVARHQ
jgi:ubiquinone/menaquinone biosynthesis C-methylase UbiE